MTAGVLARDRRSADINADKMSALIKRRPLCQTSALPVSAGVFLLIFNRMVKYGESSFRTIEKNEMLEK